MVRDVSDRFWEKVDVRGPDDCWEWQVARYRNHYGKFGLSAGQLEMEKAGHRLTHRVAFRLTNGYWPEVVEHSCDNPPCCNPAHLRAGTQPSNLSDMTRKGRRSCGAAQATANTPLTREQALALKSDRLAGMKWVDLRLKYGVAFTTIAAVMNGTHHTLRES